MSIPEEALRSATADNGAFSSVVPGLQTAWDSTSLGVFKECPRKYYYSLVLGYSGENSVHLDFGLHMHSALEFYDKAKAEGASHEDALDATVVEVLCLTKNWTSSDSYKNRFTLLRTVVWYLDHFKDDVAETIILSNGKPAVELSFKMELPLTSPEGEPYLLCGHIDRLVNMMGATWVMDRKTTKGALDSRYFSGYSPDNQMTLYTLAANIIFDVPSRGVIIDGIQVAVNFSRFARGFTYRTQGQLEEWLADTLTFIKQAEMYADTRHWPMNDKSCDKYGGCPFREICSKDPSTREPFLKSNFKKRTWNPLEAR